MRMLTKYGDEIFGDDYYEDTFELTPVDITPCSKWVFSRSNSKFSIVRDFSVLMPPWELTWMEHVHPDHKLERGGAIISHVAFQQVVEWSDSNPWKDVVRYIRSRDLSPEWITIMNIFYDRGDDYIFGGSLFTPLDDSGLAISNFECANPTRRMYNVATNCHPKELLSASAIPFQFGLSLCHASNVDTYEDKVPDAVQKKRRKSGKNPGKTFKCLDIEPMKKQSRRESEEGESDVERALHICRGHFKTYTEENPLFGQHTGTYWWPMHVRGSEDAGKVEKSYRVNEPS